MVEEGIHASANYKGVMVSSTFADLEQHRAELMNALRREELVAIGMEDYVATSDDDVISSSLNMVHKCSAYIALISHRYGQAPESAKRNPHAYSITRLEFEEAQKLDRPTIVFIMGDYHPVKAGDVETDPKNIKKLEAYRERAKEGRIYVVFEDLKDFTRKAIHAVARLRRHLDEKSEPDSTHPPPSTPVPETTETKPDAVPTHPDEPAVYDLLGRKAFAESLAERLRYIRKANKQSGDDSPFLMNLYGAWGTGKTSILNFLKQDLQRHEIKHEDGGSGWLGARAWRALERILKRWRGEASEPAWIVSGALGTGKSSVLNILKQTRQRYEDSHEDGGSSWPGARAWQALRRLLRRADEEASEPPWVVIEINAWRNQDAGPAWFTLMDAVFRQSRNQLWKHDKWRVIRLCSLEYSWRFLKRWFRWLLTAVTISLIVIWIGRWLTADASPTLKSIAQLAPVLTAIGSIVVLILTGTRTLSSGSAKDAEQFVQAQSNPSQKLADHFNDLVKRIGRPVAILVDDLDRCRAPHVVKLLETIQTLYRQAPVFYVVAADRNWLCKSFEMVYEGFQDSVGRPGRPLGHLFIEKVFQLSAPVPPLDDATRDVFWQQLIESGASPAPKQTDLLREEAVKSVNAANSEEEILAKLKVPTESREQLEALRRAAAIHLASPKIVATMEHALKRFASLVESNPRSMKRLVNAYGVQRTVAILRGVLASGGELALWTILRLRWPLLADHIELHPEAIDLILANKPISDIPEDLSSLAKDPDVLRVLRGHGVDASLTTVSVRNILNPATSEATLLEAS